ncbi:MAG: hypothetical protein ABJB97_00630 [Acidobacteriota bacterium]
MSSRHTPALSIIIPALNEAHSIGATLDAVSQLGSRFAEALAQAGAAWFICRQQWSRN